MKNGMTDGERERGGKKAKERREKRQETESQKKKKEEGGKEVIPDQPMDSRATRVVVVAATPGTDWQRADR